MERQSNLELMRIVSMLLIIASHCITQNNFMNIATGTNYYIGVICGSAASIAVNMFLFLGVYFMVDAKFKASRITKLYSNLVFYTVPLSVIMFIIGADTSIKDFIRGIFPFFGKALWFASSYIALILVSPYLSKITVLSRTAHKRLLYVLFFIISVWVTLYSFDRIEDQWLDSFIWFCYVYIAMVYYKKYKIEVNHVNFYFICGAIGYMIIAMIYATSFKYIGVFSWAEKIHFMSHNILCDIKCIPNAAISFAFFLFFLKTNIQHNRFINFLSAGTFSVYIIHQTPAFIDFMWTRIFFCKDWINDSHSSLGIIIVSILVFITFSLTD